jgi:LysM repeat protein
MDTQKRLVIEMAQQAYLPKKVNYYVQGTESGLDALAQSFGVNRRDLSRWNQMSPSEVMTPGSCLVFYKRGFEMEPVHVAQSLRADWIPSYKVASFRSARTLSDAPVSLPAPPKSLEPSREKKVAPPAVKTYTVKKGDTLARIARENSMEVKTLCDMNRLKPTSSLMLGRKLQVTSAKSAAQPVDVRSSTTKIPPRKESASICRQEKAPSGTTHRVATGDTLQSISKKYGIGVADLCRSNDITKGTALKRGQKIVVDRVEDTPKQSKPPAQVKKALAAKKDTAQDKPVREVKNGKQQAKSTKLAVKKRTN